MSTDEEREEQSKRNERFMELVNSVSPLMKLLIKLKVNVKPWGTRGFVTRWMEKYEQRKR
jgi:hypothetical protein